MVCEIQKRTQWHIDRAKCIIVLNASKGVLHEARSNNPLCIKKGIIKGFTQVSSVMWTTKSGAPIKEYWGCFRRKCI